MWPQTLPDGKDPRIAVDETSIRHFRVGYLIDVDPRVFAIWGTGWFSDRGTDVP